MKGEIKEILDKLKDANWYDELDLTGTKWLELKWEEAQILLNCITNLQKENKKLKQEIVAINDSLDEATTILSNCLKISQNVNKEIEEYCNSILERNFDISDSDFDLGQYGVARDIKSKLDKLKNVTFEEILEGVEKNEK